METTTLKIVEEAKAEYGRAVDRLKLALSTTPDDRINWSPSSDARTPLSLAAHCGMATEGMQKWFEGVPMDFSDMKAVDAGWRAAERAYTSREQVLAKIDETTSAYMNYLGGLSEEQLNGMFDTGFGQFPMASVITWPADHLRSHASQIDYIQTCYGDLDWHMG
ncbi:MAG: DinB family protein [Armatimonadetes bacterium]|nr:DinB family protein [Armatimonadota bacterium]